MAGCEFNRELEIDKYVENKENHGERFARQYLKTNMAHYRAKEAGQAVPSWDVHLTDKGLTTTDGEGLLELTEQPLVSHFSGQISGDIKMRVPIEMETVRHANALAASGADTILMPEHISENGGIFVRFVTRYTRDLIDPNKYQGSQIDLGKNMAPEEARIKMQDMVGNSHFVHSLQSSIYKDAYAFGTEKVRRGNNDVLSSQVRHVPNRETTPRHTSVLIDEKATRQNRFYSRDPLGFVVNDVAKIGKSVVVETATTAIMTGKYLFERVYKENEKKPEMSTHKINRRTNKQEAKFSEKIDRFHLIVHKRHIEMRSAKNALVIIRETGVGVGAIPFLISALVKELPRPIKAVEKSMRRHEKRELRMKNYALRMRKQEMRSNQRKDKTLHAGVAEIVAPSTEWKKKKKRRNASVEMAVGGRRYTLAERVVRKDQGRRVKRDEKIGVSPRRAAGELLTPITFERGERKKKLWLRVMRKAEKILEPKQLSKTEKKQWIGLAVAATEFVYEKKRVMRVEKNRETAMIFGVQFAWMVWMMLSTKNESKQTLDPRFRGDDKKRIGNEKEESTPWILLSIIWHLTAIREQGKGNYSMKKKRRKFPRKAVIFAFRS